MPDTRDTTPTDRLDTVNPVGAQRAPRTRPLPLASRYPNPLPPELDRVEDTFTLAAQGRLSTAGVITALKANNGPWTLRAPAPRAVDAALAYLRRWDTFYDTLMHAPCPGTRCEAQQLCPHHRQVHRRWLNRLHPIVRAAGEPRSFEQATAGLIGDVPTETKRGV